MVFQTVQRADRIHPLKLQPCELRCAGQEGKVRRVKILSLEFRQSGAARKRIEIGQRKAVVNENLLKLHMVFQAGKRGQRMQPVELKLGHRRRVCKAGKVLKSQIVERDMLQLDAGMKSGSIADPLLAAARQTQLLERRRSEGRKIRRKLAVQFDKGVLQVLTAVQRREIHRFVLILKTSEICARKTVEIGKIAVRDMHVIQLLQSGQIGQRSLDADDVQELQIGHVAQKIEILPFVQGNLLGSLVIQPMRAGIVPDAVRVVFRLDLGIVCLSDPFFVAVEDFHPIADDKQLMYARKILRF